MLVYPKSSFIKNADTVCKISNLKTHFPDSVWEIVKQYSEPHRGVSNIK